jgi:hypothetical protein
MIKIQWPCYDKYGLGYKQIHFEKESSSMTKEVEEKSYEKVIKSPKLSKDNIQVMEEDQQIRGM